MTGWNCRRTALRGNTGVKTFPPTYSTLKFKSDEHILIPGCFTHHHHTHSLQTCVVQNWKMLVKLTRRCKMRIALLLYVSVWEISFTGKQTELATSSAMMAQFTLGRNFFWSFCGERWYVRFSTTWRDRKRILPFEVHSTDKLAEHSN